MKDIEGMKRQRTAKGAEARKIIELTESEKREPTPEETARFDKIMAEGDALTEAIRKEERTQAMEMGVGKADPTEPTERAMTPGAQFVKSEAYASMIKRGVWNSDRVEVRDIIASALIDAAGGVPVAPQIVPGIVGIPTQPLRIRDLIQPGTTISNSIAFVRETLFTNAAATVKESKQGTEVSKPESKKTFEAAVEAIQTIAHWVPATRQIIADAPALRSFIDAQLTYGLKVEEEYEILFGNGVAPHLNGICPQATPYDPTLPTQLGVTNVTRVDHIRAAILQVRQALYPADAVVLNPFDWAAIELAKGTTGHYIWVLVPEGGIARLWRMPVVECDNMPLGSFLTGAFKLGAQLWDRQEAGIRIAEQHADFFIKNLVAILAEERLALTVYRPQAFVYGDFEEYGS
jgi:HK97 family phage major capsid protein